MFRKRLQFRGGGIYVIASGAKQSTCDNRMDCRVATLLAMTKTKYL
jgi:hypothetical protein